MTLNREKIKAICFDIDGTLSDTDDQVVARIEGVASRVKRVFPKFNSERFSRRLIMAVETPGNWVYSLPDIIGLDDELAWLGEKLWVFSKSSPEFLLIPGVERMLQRLQTHFPLAVVSARNHNASMAFLQQFKLTPYFQHVITAQTCPHTKPYPDPILHAARLMGVANEEILMVGDTTVDIAAAKKAGAQAVGVLCGFGEEAELIRAGADLILPGTADLVRVLDPVGF
jgi:N-acetyl-D-muramate 6-phosphate phosphatase